MVNYSRKKIKRGGKYIAEGTYGCVFGTPPLKCKDEPSRQSDSIASKLMNYYEAKYEFKESAKWREIDPDQTFSLSATKICEVDEKNIKPSNNLDKCGVKYKGPRYLVLYKNGGKDLYKLPPLSDNYEKIFSGFQNLFDGLVIAHSKGLCHTDIKPPNILSGDKEIHLRFIDFGLSVDTKNLMYFDSIYADNTTYYPYWPFELGCFDEKGALKSENDIRKRFLSFNKQTSSDFGISEFKILFEKIYEVFEETNFKDFKIIFEKVDVFSMGVTLIELMKKYFHHYPIQQTDGKNYLFYYDYKTDSYSRFQTLASKNWLSDKQLEYQNYLLKNVTQPLIDFINHCVDYNPNTRYTAQQAADEYRKLLPIFKEHLKQNDIRKGLAGLKILNEENDLPLIPTPVKEPTPKAPEPSSKDRAEEEWNEEEEEEKPKNKKNISSINPLQIAKRKYTRKVKNTTIVPKTKAELNDIYKKTSHYIKEDDLLVKIARALGSRKNFDGRTRVAVFNDILEKAKARGITFI
jgi:serine/threonine protein kinase